LNLEIKELKASIETGCAQIEAARVAGDQLTEQGGRLQEQVAEAKVSNQSSFLVSVNGVINFKFSSIFLFTFLLGEGIY
jgi:hypothetical protein